MTKVQKELNEKLDNIQIKPVKLNLMAKKQDLEKEVVDFIKVEDLELDDF